MDWPPSSWSPPLMMNQCLTYRLGHQQSILVVLGISLVRLYIWLSITRSVKDTIVRKSEVRDTSIKDAWIDHSSSSIYNETIKTILILWLKIPLGQDSLRKTILTNFNYKLTMNDVYLFDSKYTFIAYQMNYDMHKNLIILR